MSNMSELDNLLAMLDAYLAPDKKLNDERWNYLYDLMWEALSNHTEPTDKESRDAWCDATVKHMIFSYWPTERPKELKSNWPEGVNDLSWVIIDYIKGDTEARQELEDIIGEGYE